MRINWKIFLQIGVAAAVGFAVMYLQRQAGGPGNGIVPGLLGSLIAWLLIPAVSNDIGMIWRWLGHRHQHRSWADSRPEV
jgi:hypothetical protein